MWPTMMPYNDHVVPKMMVCCERTTLGCNIATVGCDTIECFDRTQCVVIECYCAAIKLRLYDRMVLWCDSKIVWVERGCAK